MKTNYKLKAAKEQEDDKKIKYPFNLRKARCRLFDLDK